MSFGNGNGNGNGSRAWFLVRTCVTIAAPIFYSVAGYLFLDMNKRISDASAAVISMQIDQAGRNQKIADVESAESSIITGLAEMTKAAAALTGQVLVLQTKTEALTKSVDELRGSNHDEPMRTQRR